jgi:hypothetical protein
MVERFFTVSGQKRDIFPLKRKMSPNDRAKYLFDPKAGGRAGENANRMFPGNHAKRIAANRHSRMIPIITHRFALLCVKII